MKPSRWCTVLTLAAVGQREKRVANGDGVGEITRLRVCCYPSIFVLEYSLSDYENG